MLNAKVIRQFAKLVRNYCPKLEHLTYIFYVTSFGARVYYGLFAPSVLDNEIDGEAFVELTLDELNSLIPNKLGVVKKIYRIIQAVSYIFGVWVFVLCSLTHTVAS